MAIDFDFNSPAYPTAPSTPKRMGHQHFISADHHLNTSPPTVPFANSLYNFLQHDVAFDFVPENKEDIKTTFMEERRKRTSSFSSSGLSLSRSRRTQSFSLNRGWECPWEEEQQQQQQQDKLPAAAMMTKPRLVSSCSSLSDSKGSKKWSFRDLFLFRSASDGRAMDRDPLKKYSAIIRKHDEDFRNSSLRSIGSGSGSKRRGGVSAHELHYKVNRAVANDLKKKTFLPYKQGILGRLAFNPSVHALSNGFGFSHKN